jgi:hypothetical protein
LEVDKDGAIQIAIDDVKKEQTVPNKGNNYQESQIQYTIRIAKRAKAGARTKAKLHPTRGR